MKISIATHNILNAARHIQLLGEMFGVGCINPYATFEILLKAEREAHRQTTKECNESITEEASEKWYENFIKRLTKTLVLIKCQMAFLLTMILADMR